MIKPFAVMIALLVLMLSSIGLHYTLFPYDKATVSMKKMTTLIQMAPLSLSVNYDESLYNQTYPEMQTLGRMDFVYEQ